MKIKTIVVPKEITEMGIIPVKRSKTSHLLLVALCDGELCHLLADDNGDSADSQTQRLAFSMFTYYLPLIFDKTP